MAWIVHKMKEIGLMIRLCLLILTPCSYSTKGGSE